MLKNEDLQAFLTEAQQLIPQITGAKTMASENRYARFARKIKHEDEEVFLIAILPSARVTTRDEDNTRWGNNLSFMLVRKLDSKAGDEEYDRAFNIAQKAVIKLFELIASKTQNFDADCVFKYFDLDTAVIVPVENFHQTNGYDLSIRLKTHK